MKESETLRSIGLTGWGLYAARTFAKKEVITVYVGEDIGQAGSEEAVTNLNRLIAQDRGRHVMQINRRSRDEETIYVW